MRRVLLIGGTDSSGGAGLVRDVATVSALQMAACCAVTAVTAQSDTAVRAVEVMPAALVGAQIETALAGGTVAAVKIGMLATAATVSAVARALTAQAALPVVLDPVLVSSSGTALLDAAGRRALLEELLPLAELVTPNLPELAALLGDEVGEGEEAQRRAAFALVQRGARAVLLKGGHAAGAECVDLLLSAGAEARRFSAPRLATTLRGSGCALAAAIAALRARGVPLASACQEAKAFVTTLWQARALA